MRQFLQHCAAIGGLPGAWRGNRGEQSSQGPPPTLSLDRPDGRQHPKRPFPTFSVSALSAAAAVLEQLTGRYSPPNRHHLQPTTLPAAMGNDGGSIPDRRDLVRSKPKVRPRPCLLYASNTDYPPGRTGRQGKPDPRDVVLLRPLKSVSSSSASVLFPLVDHPHQRPLQEPIVSCPLGKLYNKDAVLEFLIDRNAFGAEGEVVCGHIRSIKVRGLSTVPLVLCSLHPRRTSKPSNSPSTPPNPPLPLHPPTLRPSVPPMSALSTSRR